MKRIFVDTSAWDAIADKGDVEHLSALKFRDEIVEKYRLVTSNYILDELYTLLLMNIGYTKALDFKQKLDHLSSENVLDIAWIDEDMANQAWDAFQMYNIDKTWSFTDCTSFTVMKNMGLTEVFAFDHHFEQMGFIRRP